MRKRQSSAISGATNSESPIKSGKLTEPESPLKNMELPTKQLLKKSWLSFVLADLGSSCSSGFIGGGKQPSNGLQGLAASHAALLPGSSSSVENIGKLHEKIKQDGKLTASTKARLKMAYEECLEGTMGEVAALRDAVKVCGELSTLLGGDVPQKMTVTRRGVLMNNLQRSAFSLPIFIPDTLDEDAPALCGAIAAESTYLASPGDMVAARVSVAADADENWILAQVISYNANSQKYEVYDIDSDEGRATHHLARRRVLPLPKWKANPKTNPEALFPPESVVLALYPQTTCFYKGIVQREPVSVTSDYAVSFEDTTYADGFSPALDVPQKYLITHRA